MGPVVCRARRRCQPRPSLEASTAVMGQEKISAESAIGQQLEAVSCLVALSTSSPAAAQPGCTTKAEVSLDEAEMVGHLATVLGDEYKLSMAERLFRRQLEDREASLGEQHPDTLRLLNDLSLLLSIQGRHAEAEGVCLRLCRLRERIFGAEHPETLTCLSNLALLQTIQGNLGGAELAYRRILVVQMRTLGMQHPETQNSIRSLWQLLQAMDKADECSQLQEQVHCANIPLVA